MLFYTNCFWPVLQPQPAALINNTHTTCPVFLSPHRCANKACSSESSGLNLDFKTPKTNLKIPQNSFLHVRSYVDENKDKLNSQSRGSELVRCFLNCSFRSLLTPMSWNIRCSLDVYSKPHACCRRRGQEETRVRKLA